MGEPVQLNLQAQHSAFPSCASNAIEPLFGLAGVGPCEAEIRRRRAARAVPELSVFVGILPTFIGYKSCSRSDTLVLCWPDYYIFIRIL